MPPVFDLCERPRRIRVGVDVGLRGTGDEEGVVGIQRHLPRNRLGLRARDCQVAVAIRGRTVLHLLGARLEEDRGRPGAGDVAVQHHHARRRHHAVGAVERQRDRELGEDRRVRVEHDRRFRDRFELRVVQGDEHAVTRLGAVDRLLRRGDHPGGRVDHVEGAVGARFGVLRGGEVAPVHLVALDNLDRAVRRVAGAGDPDRLTVGEPGARRGLHRRSSRPTPFRRTRRRSAAARTTQTRHEQPEPTTDPYPHPSHMSPAGVTLAVGNAAVQYLRRIAHFDARGRRLVPPSVARPRPGGGTWV